jgi:ribosomal-protein-alanine N-acetyltransferase
LVGDRYVLRPFITDLITDCYVDWLNDPDVNEFLEIRFVPQGRESAFEFVNSFWQELECYLWAIYPIDSDKSVGTVTLQKVDRNNGGAEFGIMVGDKDHWGKGASAEAIHILVEFAFNTLGLRRLAAGTYSKNHGINFTLKKMGFVIEGKIRKAFLARSGTYIDGYRWGLLAEEWIGLKSALSPRS